METKMKKYQDGGKTGAQLKAKGSALKKKGEGMKLKGQGQAMKNKGTKLKELGTSIKNNPIQSAVDKAVFGEVMVRKNSMFKTGGMVNPNAQVKRQAVPGSKGVKSGVNTKVSAQNSPKGRTGGTNKSVPRPTKG